MSNGAGPRQSIAVRLTFATRLAGGDASVADPDRLRGRGRRRRRRHRRRGHGARRRTDKVTLPAARSTRFLHAWSRATTRRRWRRSSTAARPISPPSRRASSRPVPGSTATYTRTGLVRRPSDAATTATYHAQVTLAGLGAIAWDGTLAAASTRQARLAHHVEPERSLPGPRRPVHLTVKRRGRPARRSSRPTDRARGRRRRSSRSASSRDHIKTPADLAAVKLQHEDAARRRSRARRRRPAHAGRAAELLPAGRRSVPNDADYPAHPRRARTDPTASSSRPRKAWSPSTARSGSADPRDRRRRSRPSD